MPTHTTSRACCLIASLARMHARAECIACSGPHAIGVPTRTAEQNREICWRVADGRFGPFAGAAGETAAALGPLDVLAGRVSDASAAAAPSRGDTWTAV